jgi:hypothetical protein
MDRPIAVCIGMSWWKRRRMADFLTTEAARPAVAGAVEAAVARGGAISVWAAREPSELAAAAAARHVACDARRRRVYPGPSSPRRARRLCALSAHSLDGVGITEVDPWPTFRPPRNVPFRTFAVTNPNVSYQSFAR